jgi:hypothetical protein
MNQRPNASDTRLAAPRSRRHASAVLCAAIALAALAAQSAPLEVQRDGERLVLSASALHFLAGAPLQQLHDGRSVTYVFSVAIEPQRGQAHGGSLTRRVVVSYDLWEERFSVSGLDVPKTSASHLTSAGAEAWCFDLLSLPVRMAPADGSFVVKLECSPRDGGAQPGDARSAATFTGLIDLFSRKSRIEPPHWEAVSLPLRLADLIDKSRK